MGTEYGIYTIIQYSRGVDAYDFVNYDIPKDKDRLRKLLSRCGISGPVLGAFELDFHDSPQNGYLITMFLCVNRVMKRQLNG